MLASRSSEPLQADSHDREESRQHHGQPGEPQIDLMEEAAEAQRCRRAVRAYKRPMCEGKQSKGEDSASQQDRES